MRFKSFNDVAEFLRLVDEFNCKMPEHKSYHKIKSPVDEILLPELQLLWAKIEELKSRMVCE